jgi:hypothetical protein
MEVTNRENNLYFKSPASISLNKLIHGKDELLGISSLLSKSKRIKLH